MAALTADRDTKERRVPHATRHERLAGSSDEFYVGQLVAIDVDATGSPVVPAAAGDLTLQVCGRCEERLTTGANNTKTVKFKSGAFYYNNGATFEAIDANDIGKQCFVVDDNTVGISGATGANAKAGRIYDFDEYGVCVNIEWPQGATLGATTGGQ
jgi:hypothetical protein